MKKLIFIVLLFYSASCCAGSRAADRQEAEYYVAAYAEHYGVPVEFVRAIVEQESGWQRCPVSAKGATGLMQLMPETARQLGVKDRCNARENISGGVRYLALLMKQFGGDLRLVAAAYYAGSIPIAKRGLNYKNRDVVSYVTSVRARVERQRVQQTTKANQTGRSR